MISLLLILALAADTEPAMTGADLSARIAVLASDEFEGRGPASPGERRTIEYLVAELKAAGLSPGNGESWVQEVPLVSTTPTAKPEVSIKIGGQPQDIVFGRDLMIVCPVPDAQVDLQGTELVFCGYGVVAPEFGWNDYEGIDMRGKTAVVLVNDPGFATQDPALFRGNAMTYYGRYTYKFEEAKRQGASACLVVHAEAAAGYPWQVVSRSWGGTQHSLGEAADRPLVEGWITRESIARVATAAGHDWQALEQRAKTRAARPVSLGAQAGFAFTNSSKRSASHNVVARVVGSERPEETVLLCAHWDHLGRKPGRGKDEIYNGAHDNASGSAGLLELAQAFAAMDPAPRRSLLFLWVTAEESGLLGSKYYAEHPLVPLEHTVAGINMDGLNLYGPMEDLVVVGYGASELEELLAQAAAAQDRVLVPEATPEKGYYYRSDHFSFAKKGVPMLYAGGGQVNREHGRAWVTEQEQDYLRRRYHQPSDEFDPTWDLRGALEDLRLYYAVARRLAAGDEWPNWNPGNEFRAIRDASRGR
jgi:Zn-dependent M28 family amino/carboxypeptidase